jgi:two-component system phosphate regulon sensor histidine kinase PhoR
VKLDIRTKLVLVSLAILAVSIIVLEAYLRPLIEGEIVETIKVELFARLTLIQRDVEPGLRDRSEAEWDALADELGSRAGARVTFVRWDGKVLGDSELDGARLASVESHLDRPEVRQALSGEPGFATRTSATLGRRLSYAALPLTSGGKVFAVARLATPLERIDNAISRLRRLLLLGGLLAMAVAVLMSTVAAQLMSQALRDITQAARRMSAGDLGARTRIKGDDEVGELGRTLDGLAENLSQTLAALRGERDLFGRMLESMQEGVLVLDRDLRILLVNPALREMLLLGADVAGRLPIETIRNADLQTILDRATTHGARASGEVELSGLMPRRFMVHATPLGGEPRGLVVVFVDVTEIRRLESMRKDFVANVSHELRTPITAVRSAAETARRTMERDPDAALRFIDMIERNARRLQELVEDLLELSRIESKQFRPTIESVDLVAAVGGVLGLFRDAAERKRLRLEGDVPGVAARVRADRRGIEQVLTNLVENAVKYCPEGASISVRVREKDGLLRIAVEDTGPGIEPKHLPRLFERFYRADKGRSRDMGGTGLGLSIVKHLVEAMDGHVGVESTPGRGTTFWFTLARTEGPPLPPATLAVAAANTNGTVSAAAASASGEAVTVGAVAADAAAPPPDPGR